MIPKVAWFHWTGPPMSWLRKVSVATFKKYNPDWDVRVIDTPEWMKKYNLGYAQQADWTWWNTLRHKGGFQVATDIVFVRPIPDDWSEWDLNCCLNGCNRVYQFAMLGASANHPFLVDVDVACRKLAEGTLPVEPTHLGKGAYQSFGVDMLLYVGGDKMGYYGDGKMFDQPMDAMCYYDSGQPPILWGSGYEETPVKALGIHWYGGHEVSKLREPKAHANGDSLLERLAVEHMKGAPTFEQLGL